MAISGWKRLDYLVHRWIGIVLGLLVLIWFASGFMLMYHPYPLLTESKQLSLLREFVPVPALIGFPAAAAGQDSIARGRLEQWNGRLVYRLWRDDGTKLVPAGLIDARKGTPVTPISAEDAVRAARGVVGPVVPLRRVDLLPTSDYYAFGTYFIPHFPLYRVRFDDAPGTAVYVGRNSGAVMATVTSVTRWTTWLGTVPHFLYFKWLYYDRMPLWIWVNIILPSVTMVVAVSGIVLGLLQLFPRRRRGEWRLSSYRGVSKWHHVAGVVFGAMVLTWMISGLFQMIGVEATPGRGQVEVVRGGAIRWEDVTIGEAAAWDSLRARMPATGLPRAVDLSQFNGRPGYEFILADGRTFWVDAASGVTRGDLTRSDVEMAARRVVGSAAPIIEIDRLTEYDTYYYARHGREEHLPVWRVRFGTEDGSTVYLHTVSGTPLGFVNTTVRTSRWLRDGLHSLDLPRLNNRRPLWDFVMLPLMFGGMLCAFTGVWLLIRRVRRMAERPPPRP